MLQVSSPTGSDVSTESSSGITTRSALMRLSRLQEASTLFSFSPPTALGGADKEEGKSQTVPGVQIVLPYLIYIYLMYIYLVLP